MPVGPYDSAALRVAFDSVSLERAQNRAVALSMTPRQTQLNYYAGFYECEQYEGRLVGWNGLRVPGLAERNGILTGAAVPPGYYNAAPYEHVTLEHRRPDVEQHKVREIVTGFTDYLFGDDHHPTLQVKGSDEVTTWLASMATSCGYWQRWAAARNLAGAMGAVGLSFKFNAYYGGRLVVEVHDPRWCLPEVIDQTTGEVARLEVKFMYPLEVPATGGGSAEVWHWYRRVIDAERDVTYKPVRVDPERFPEWIEDDRLVFRHGLGFCPAIWVQNTEAPGRLDGSPDCKGLFGNTEVEDRLLSQAATGAVHNADPTLHIATDDQSLASLRKGHGVGIRTEKGGAVEYVEHTGSGADAALRVAEVVDRVSMRAARYVRIEEHDGEAVTATEIRRRMGPMIAAISTRRGHWQRTAIVPFTERIIRATREVSARTGQLADGRETVTVVAVPYPAAPAPDPAADPTAEPAPAAAVLVDVRWPEVITPTSADALSAAQAAVAATSGHILDTRTAVEFVAPMFGGDPEKIMAALEGENAARAAELESELLAKAGPPAPGTPGAAPGAAPGTEPAAEALNGAQAVFLAGLAVQAFNGEIPRMNAIAVAMVSFPMVNRALIEAAIPEAKAVPVAAIDPATGLPIPPPPPGPLGAPPPAGGPPAPPPPAPPPGSPPPAPGTPA